MSINANGGIKREEWNNSIASLKGDFLQSWEWGSFKARHGWHVERLHIKYGDSEALAQLLFRQQGPFSIAYIPRGPSFGDDVTVLDPLIERIDACCRRHRSIALYIDPDRSLPEKWIDRKRGFYPGSVSIQTPRTVKVPLGHDDALIAQMRKDTRQNLNYALRHNAVAHAVEASTKHRAIFYRLMQETGERQGFGIHTKSYYDDFLDVMGDAATLIFAERDGQVTHALIAVCNGIEGRSMYSGSSSALRGRGDGVLVRFAAMQWARDCGCKRYDLGGIAPTSGKHGIEGSGSPSANLKGVDSFKLGFGGTIVTYPQTLERCYLPKLAWLLRFHPRFRSGDVIDSDQT